MREFIDTYLVFLVLGLVIGLFIIDHQESKRFVILEYRIEILEEEINTNKLLLKETQKLLVPDEVALLNKIPARQ